MIKNKKLLLEVKNLKTYFFTEDGIVKAVDGVDFEVYKGETLGVVGESACGKSVTAFSIMRLLDYPGKTVGGEVIFKGENLLKKTEDEMRRIRGKEIAMIFQEPMTALNPVLTVGFQISEALMMHFKISKKEALKKSIELLKKVEIPIPEQRVNEYPHQLSGGMRQRAMIAMAMSCDPTLLIADEPTTAFTQPTVLLKTPFFIGKYLTKFLISNSELAIYTHTPTKRPFFTSFTTLSIFQHLTKCPSSTLIKGDSSSLHLLVANLHLGLNLHPVGKCKGLGTIPGMTFNLFISTSSRGIEVSKPKV
ncbi:hypothetical protein ES708_15338 [subsurface metagenome]